MAFVHETDVHGQKWQRVYAIHFNEDWDRIPIEISICRHFNSLRRLNPPISSHLLSR
ncbi:hypothetical protein V7111_26930 [Neobacillus niacini]|uniref:hypothetical protein n=1 Tax=Neobacillus niacini TaxID=86668 RepID=UPI0030022C87